LPALSGAQAPKIRMLQAKIVSKGRMGVLLLGSLLVHPSLCSERQSRCGSGLDTDAGRHPAGADEVVH
jgi:hypothetical protein